MENALVEHWAAVTDAIRRTCHSLGSRLHRTENPLVFIAYAQWPSEEVFNTPWPFDQWTEEELNARTKMKECSASIETLHKMHVLNDRLALNMV
jgi:hypothetical protein